MKHWWRLAILALLLPALFLLGGCGLADAANLGARLLDMVDGSEGPAAPEPKEAGTLTGILSQLLEKNPPVPEGEDEILGVWISYLDLSPLTVGKTGQEFSASAREICRNAAGMGLNTLFVQARPFGDSFYPSELFPWSKWASGTLGQALPYDPVQLLQEEAAAAGLSFHIWINPLRTVSEQEIGAIPERYPLRQWYGDPVKRAENLILWEGTVYLNPASAEARQLIADGAVEALERYHADGVHIDDYFYPPKLPPEVDLASYQVYLDGGGILPQEDWRRENTFRMVKELGDAVHASGSGLLFGVSPRGITAQNYQDLFIDVRKWMEEPGLLDYVAPQIYFGFAHETAPFDQVAEEWDTLSQDTGVPLVAGLAAYKVGEEDAFAGSGSREWMEDPELLAKQLLYARGLDCYGGVVFFRYENLFPEQPSASAAGALEALKPVLPAV